MPTTVDKIRRALEKRDGIAEEEMRPLSEAYRAEVQTVNQRLDDAVMLLRKGLRSEAIQRVEMTPNALDKAAELEFPEWDEWNEILQFMGIPLPPKLNQDYVAQINEAIIESLPLDALLRRHRRLAIAKAPLSVRLRTLRQIARVDPGNSVWQDDVEVWEKTRLNQIDSELKHALEQEDSRHLHQLHQELTGAKWRVAPSPRLVEQTSFAAQAHERQSQENELNQLAPLLNKAFEDLDEATARSVRSQWQSIRARYHVAVPDALTTRVAPAMRWLEDLDRQAVMESEREGAVQDLQSALDSNAPVEEIQQAYQQASRFGQPVPDELATRVDRLASEPARRAKRKLVLAGAVAAVVLLALMAGAGMYLASSGRKTAEQETIDQMEQFVSAQQFDEAINYFNSVLTTTPEIAGAPRMVALKATAQEAVDQESQRRERFEKLLLQASSDDPALIDEILLPQLEELASTDGEKARVDDLRKRKADYNAGQTLRQSDELLGKVADYSRQFGELAARGSSPSNQMAMQQLLSTVIRLPKQYPMSADDALAKQETLRSQIASEISRMKDQTMASEQRQGAIDSLLNSRSLEVYADRLRDYSTRSVSRTNFIEFQTVIDEEDHWANVDRVNRWLEMLSRRLDNGLTSTEAASLIESAETLRKTVASIPAFEVLSDFDSTMDEIVGRNMILNGGYARISNHPLSRLVTLPIEDADSPTGTTHYLMFKTFVEQNRDRMDRSGSIGVAVVSDALGGVRTTSFQGPLPKVLDEPMESVNQVVSNKSKLAVSFDQKWEQTFMIQVSEVMKRPQLDGVIKEWLINQLLDMATRGSRRLKDLIPQTLRTLERRTSVRDNWHDPRAANTELNPELERTIKSELNVAYSRLASPLADYETVASQRLRWLGFLARSSNGQIETHLREALPEYDGTLYVAAPAREGDAETALFSVGKLKQGHIQLIPNPVHQVPGRPLFVFPD